MDVLRGFTMNLSAIITFQYLSKVQTALDLTSIVRLYFSILPLDIKMNVKLTRGRRIEKVFAGKSGMVEIIPSLTTLQCNHCMANFKTLHSLNRHEFTKHVRSIPCTMYTITHDGENKQCNAVFQERKLYIKHQKLIHNKT